MIKEAPPAHGKEDRINGKNAKVNRTRKQERCRQLLIPCAKQMHEEGHLQQDRQSVVILNSMNGCGNERGWRGQL
jgi:hypothetical protein